MTGWGNLIAGKGRRGDTRVAHLSDWQQKLLKQLMGGAGTTNPETGAKEFYDSYEDWSRAQSASFAAKQAGNQSVRNAILNHGSKMDHDTLDAVKKSGGDFSTIEDISREKGVNTALYNAAKADSSDHDAESVYTPKNASGGAYSNNSSNSSNSNTSAADRARSLSRTSSNRTRSLTGRSSQTSTPTSSETGASGVTNVVEPVNFKEEDIRRIFDEEFGRSVEEAGLDYWRDFDVPEGGSLREAIVNAASPDDQERLKAEDIKQIFQQEFNRSIQDAGLDYWSDFDVPEGGSLREAIVNAASPDDKLRQDIKNLQQNMNDFVSGQGQQQDQLSENFKQQVNDLASRIDALKSGYQGQNQETSSQIAQYQQQIRDLVDAQNRRIQNLRSGYEDQGQELRQLIESQRQQLSQLGKGQDARLNQLSETYQRQFSGFQEAFQSALAQLAQDQQKTNQAVPEILDTIPAAIERSMAARSEPMTNRIASTAYMPPPGVVLNRRTGEREQGRSNQPAQYRSPFQASRRRGWGDFIRV